MSRLARHLLLIAALYALVLLALGFAAGRASAQDAHLCWTPDNGVMCFSPPDTGG